MRPLWWLAQALVALIVSVPAAAQPWPTKTIRAVVPLTAGSAVDIVPRIVLEQVAAQIGQSIVVENRTGASGTIGIRSVATSPPDGYTLLAGGSAALAINPHLYQKIGYNTLREIGRASCRERVCT